MGLNQASIPPGKKRIALYKRIHCLQFRLVDCYLAWSPTPLAIGADSVGSKQQHGCHFFT